eukprot:comp17102_c0_seq1/m.15861 comp17102_c0_seq1/g.15861  ORF comp17102_c0_seq1/g.15861 comp17102_c0_seq1/m.15861 type:complete len:315 (-) comp17102_c0_seq1:476-1420(-)
MGKKRKAPPSFFGPGAKTGSKKLKLVQLLKTIPPPPPKKDVPGGQKGAQGKGQPAQKQSAKKNKQKLPPPRILYRMEQRVLVVGDGNCSFSRALAEHFGCGPTLVCTTYDDEKTMNEKYEDAAEHVKTIQDFGGRVLHSIDCCKLGSYPQLREGNHGGDQVKYDCIVFNFPHVGLGIKDMDRNIAANQKLIFGFLQSATTLLAPRGEIHVTVKQGEPYDSWRTAALGTKEAGLSLKAGVPFAPSQYPGYRHRRTLGHADGVSTDDNEDISKGARTYIFVERTEEEEGGPKKKAKNPAGTKGDKKKRKDNGSDSE